MAVFDSFPSDTQTGVGKSSLINHAFGVKEAVGLPQTKRRITDSLILNIYRSSTIINQAKRTSKPTSSHRKTAGSFYMIVKGLSRPMETMSRLCGSSFSGEGICRI